MKAENGTQTAISIQDKLDLLLNSIDDDGRALIYLPKEDNKIYLKDTSSQKEPRCLGKLLIGRDNILYTKFEDEANVFKKTSAWSVNYQILKHVDHIHYETRLYDYTISKERALEYGEFFHFKDTTEKKVYIPLIYWDRLHKGLKNIQPKEWKLRTIFGQSWYEKLETVLLSNYMEDVVRRVWERRKHTTIYPAHEDVFRAFKHCPFYHTKVVILGQDPYHTGDTADGLAFSYKKGINPPVTKSLDVIYLELEDDLYNGFNLHREYNLIRWAKQGVFLLNTILTVDKGKPLSHRDIGWKRFTDIVLWELMNDPSPKVFVAWGKEAQETLSRVAEKLDTSRHEALIGPHPAYDLRIGDSLGNVKPNYPHTFAGGKYFSKINYFLKTHSKKEITW